MNTSEPRTGAERYFAGLPPVEPEAITKHGICKGKRSSRAGVVYSCGKRTILWLPAGLCQRCLLSEAQDAGLIPEQETDSAV